MQPKNRPSSAPSAPAMKMRPLVSGETKGIVKPFVVMYGMGGSGKTMLSFCVPNAVHVMTEYSTDRHAIFTDTWDDFERAVNNVPSEYPIVIDTIDGAWDFLNSKIAKKCGAPTTAHVGFDKGMKEVVEVWNAFIRRLRSKHPFVMILGHERMRIRQVGQHEDEVYTPMLHERGTAILKGISDATIYLRREGATRKLIVRNVTDIDIKCRYKHWFSGQSIINLTSNPDEAERLFCQQLETLT